jgi:hypothetical protein
MSELLLEIADTSNLVPGGTVEFDVIGDPPTYAGQLFVEITTQDETGAGDYAASGRVGEALALDREPGEYTATVYYVGGTGRVVLGTAAFNIEE